MPRTHYQDRANRDAAARRAQEQGQTVRRSSARNQILSPDYVADYAGTASPNGFGGSSPELFGVIYTLEVH